jgi:hypothetical protein
MAVSIAASAAAFSALLVPFIGVPFLLVFRQLCNPVFEPDAVGSAIWPTERPRVRACDGPATPLLHREPA